MSDDILRDAHGELIADIIRYRPPRSVVSAVGDDFRDLANHLTAIAKAFDRYVAVLGDVARGHDSRIDVQPFARPAWGEIEGNAVFELDQAAERADREEHHAALMASNPGYARLAHFLGEG